MILVVCSTVMKLNTDIMKYVRESAEKTRIGFQPEYALLPKKGRQLGLRSNNSEMKQN